MEFNLLTLIGISMAAMFFGYFFGLFEGRGQGYKRRKKEEAVEKPAEAAPQVLTPPTSAAPAPIPTPATAIRDQSLLRLSLGADQKPGLELDGRRVDTSALAPEQRKRLVDLMVFMRPWIEAPSAGRPAAVPPPPPAAAQVRPVPAPVPPLSPVVNSSAPSVARPTPEPGAPNTMVGQIDAILQARIAGTSLAERGIRLMDSGQGGAAIYIGLQRYPGLGDVPDAEVQAAIKAAIAEWEARYTPG